MRRFTLAVGLTVALGLASCSSGAVAGGVGTLDAAATRACQGLRLVIDDRAAGALAPAQLRSMLGAVYGDAQSSANPLIRTRAVALYADATVIATGGEPGSLNANLDAMQRTCSGSG
jgi:hypothetical protein